MDNMNPFGGRRCLMWMLAGLVLGNGGCAWLGMTPKKQIEWPDPASTPLIGAPMEAGAAIAAAAAVREMVRQNDDARLFEGCSSPEQGLDVAVFKDPKSGLYFVVLHQRFDRCGGPVGRVLDWWYEYAVTAQGEVVGEAPPSAGEEPPPPPAPDEQIPAISTPSSTPEGSTSAGPPPASAPVPSTSAPTPVAPAPGAEASPR